VREGEMLTVAAGTRYAARNTGMGPAEVLAMAIVPTVDGTGDRPFGAVLRPSDTTGATGPPDASSGLVPSVATPAPEPLVWPPGVRGRYLVRLILPALPTAATVTAGRAVLAPGASFRPPAVDGPALPAVEGGSLALAVGRGRVQLVHGTGEGTRVVDSLGTGENRLGAGEAALVLPRAVGFARNGGDGAPVVVLVTITPA
jgi:hypothetical protein